MKSRHTGCGKRRQTELPLSNNSLSLHLLVSYFSLSSFVIFLSGEKKIHKVSFVPLQIKNEYLLHTAKCMPLLRESERIELENTGHLWASLFTGSSVSDSHRLYNNQANIKLLICPSNASFSHSLCVFGECVKDLQTQLRFCQALS